MFTAVLQAPLVAAQNETSTTNTTYENVTVQVPKLPQITPAVRPEATVTADFNGTAVVLRYVCLYFTAPEKCPDLIVRLVAGTQVVKEFGYRVNPSTDCHDNVCLYYITVRLPTNFTAMKLLYTLRYPDNTSRTYTVDLTRQELGSSKVLKLLSVGILLGVVMGMSLHENPFAVAMGAFAAPLIIYLLSKIGLIELNFFIVNAVILLALVLFFMTRGSRRGG